MPRKPKKTEPKKTPAEAPAEQPQKVDFNERRLEIRKTWERIMNLANLTLTRLENGELEMKASLLKILTETMKMSLELADEFEDIQINQEFVENRQEVVELNLPVFDDD